jgi:hypothetical protein
MLLKQGDKIFIANRRLFEKDELRFFIGEVDGYEAGIVKVTGHSYFRDVIAGRVAEKAEERTKIFSLSSGTLLVYQLPQSISPEALKFVSLSGRLVLTDGQNFTMNMSEHGPSTGF